jgi:hypothetical protein
MKPAAPPPWTSPAEAIQPGIYDAPTVDYQPSPDPGITAALGPGWPRPAEASPPAVRRGILARSGCAIYSGCGWLFGVFSLIAGLALLAAIPVVQFLTLGYLLEVGGRVARTGRLRDGFVGVRKAARVGSIVLGTVLMLAPLYVVSALLVSAQLIDPGGPSAQGLEKLLNVLMVLAVLHIVGAWSRGGKLRHFLWPMGSPRQLYRRWRAGEWKDVLGLVFLGNIWWLGRRLAQGGYYAQARDAVWDFVVSLRLPYYFWLGLRGFLAGLAVLLLPVTLIALGRQVPVMGFVGAFLLIVAVLYVPFLQMRLARDGRLREGFRLRGVREDFCRAPIAFAFALLITLLFAFPLWFFKIEMIPRDGAWMMTPFFIVSIWPARLLTGWAYGRATHHPTPRHGFFRWTARLAMVPMAGAYVFFAYFSQFTSWYGIWSLYEQPAFLLPVPFFNFSSSQSPC